MYKFVIPDSAMNRWLNIILCNQRRLHREWFYQDTGIDTVYGVPANCIWNGNRYLSEDFCRPEDYVRNVIKLYSSWGVKYCVLFTNFLLKPEMLLDTYANKLCEKLNEFGGNVMVSTQMMYDYIASNYPKIEISWSTTTDYGVDYDEQIGTIDRLSRHNIVVLPYHLNNRTDLLAKLHHRENIEILADEKCWDNCPLRRQHEANANSCNLYQRVYSECLMQSKMFNSVYVHNTITHNITRKGLKRYSEMGINLFKLEGRAGAWELLLKSYKQYFLLDSHWDDFQQIVDNYLDSNRELRV